MFGSRTGWVGNTSRLGQREKSYRCYRAGKENAVRDVLFKGVVAGSRECSVRPLITEVNAQERYASYFNDFFRDGGEYLKYVSIEDKKTNSNTKASNKTQISYSTTVRVLRSQLQQKLIEDKILKP